MKADPYVGNIACFYLSVKASKLLTWLFCAASDRPCNLPEMSEETGRNKLYHQSQLECEVREILLDRISDGILGVFCGYPEYWYI